MNRHILKHNLYKYGFFGKDSEAFGSGIFGSMIRASVTFVNKTTYINEEIELHLPGRAYDKAGDEYDDYISIKCKKWNFNGFCSVTGKVVGLINGCLVLDTDKGLVQVVVCS